MRRARGCRALWFLRGPRWLPCRTVCPGQSVRRAWRPAPLVPHSTLCSPARQPPAGLSRTVLEMCVHIWLRFFWSLRAALESRWVRTPALPPVIVHLVLSAAPMGVGCREFLPPLGLGAQMRRAWPPLQEQPVVGPGPAQGIPRALRFLLLCGVLCVSPSLQILNKC